jgi:hypothetical protein
LDQREEHQDPEQEVIGESAETVLHVQDLGFSAWGEWGRREEIFAVAGSGNRATGGTRVVLTALVQ